VTELSATGKERAHLWPRFLPDGTKFIVYTLTDFDETSGVNLGSLGSKATRRIIQSDANAVFSAARTSDARPNSSRNGYLIFIRNRTLYGQKFDGTEVDGTPMLVAEEVGSIRSMSLAPVSVSENGVLVYQTVGKTNRQLIWFDRSGRQIAPIGEPGDYGPPRISPDGRRIVVGRIEPGKDTADLWILNEGATATRLTATAHHEGAPIWSPDGSRLAFFSNHEGNYNLYQRKVGSDGLEVLVKDSSAKYPNDWSRDGRYLLYGSISETTKSDLMVLHASDRRSYPVSRTIHGEGYGSFSPDGRWVAFQSDQEGRADVFVQAFRAEGSDTPRRYKVSTNGGGLPRWRQDGKELYYITSSGRMMAVAVRSSDTTFEAEAPRMLFQTRPVPKTWNLFDVTGDGQRFVLNVPLEWSSSAPITVVTNWMEKIKQ